MTEIERITANSLPQRTIPSSGPPRTNGLPPTQNDNSAPGLLRQLNNSRRNLEKELSDFKSSLVGKEVFFQISNFENKNLERKRLKFRLNVHENWE